MATHGTLCLLLSLVVTALVTLTTFGCKPEEPSPQRPQSYVGTIRQIREPDPCAQEGSAGPQPAESLAERVDGITCENPDLNVEYSPDGSQALVYPHQSGESNTRLWLVTDSSPSPVQVEVDLAPPVGLDAAWSRDASRVAVFPRNVYKEQRPNILRVACLDLREGTPPEVHTGSGPDGSGRWSVSGINPDGRMLFARTLHVFGGGQIWTIDLPDCTFSLLYTQPPPRLEKGSLYAKEGFENMLPSPDGQLLVFNSYPPEKFRSEVLWIVNLQTREHRQATWENSEVYWHSPRCWRNSRTVVFAAGHGTYELTLEEGLWDETGMYSNQ